MSASGSGQRVGARRLGRVRVRRLAADARRLVVALCRVVGRRAEAERAQRVAVAHHLLADAVGAHEQPGVAQRVGEGGLKRRGPLARTAHVAERRLVSGLAVEDWLVLGGADRLERRGVDGQRRPLQPHPALRVEQLGGGGGARGRLARSSGARPRSGAARRAHRRPPPRRWRRRESRRTARLRRRSSAQTRSPSAALAARCTPAARRPARARPPRRRASRRARRWRGAASRATPQRRRSRLPAAATGGGGGAAAAGGDVGAELKEAAAAPRTGGRRRPGAAG